MARSSCSTAVALVSALVWRRCACAPRETCVLTRRGKPVATMVPIRPGVGLESFGLSHDPEFIDIINRSWESYKKTSGTSLEELREAHGLVAKPSRKKAPRAR